MTTLISSQQLIDPVVLASARNSFAVFRAGIDQMLDQVERLVKEETLEVDYSSFRIVTHLDYPNIAVVLKTNAETLPGRSKEKNRGE